MDLDRKAIQASVLKAQRGIVLEELRHYRMLKRKFALDLGKTSDDQEQVASVTLPLPGR